MQWLSRLENVLGEENVKKLVGSTALVCGLGGVGGHCVEALARCGISSFILVDKDVFEISNLNRQTLSDFHNIGRAKTEVARERILSINPDAKVKIYTQFLDKSNTDEILSNNIDIAVDAIDSIQSKTHFLLSCLDKKISVVSSMGAALRTDPLKIRTDDILNTFGCPLAKLVRKTLVENGYQGGIMCVFSPEKSKKREMGQSLGSYAPVTGSFGLVLADLAIRSLIGE